MSKKDMFRKEQRFSFRKFSFGLASALIANVIFGGAIASSPVVHADTAIEPSTVNAGEAGPAQTSQRSVSLSYTVNLVDQAGQAISSQTKTLEVTTSQADATASVELAADLVPEGYTLVSGLGQVTVTEHAENVFTVVVEKVAVTPEHTEGVSSDEEEQVQEVSENAKGDSTDTKEKVAGATEEQAAPVDKTNLEQLISEANLLIPEGEKKAEDNAELATAVQAAKPVLASAQAVYDDAAATGDQVLAQETDLRVANKAIGDQLALLSDDGTVSVSLDVNNTNGRTDLHIRTDYTVSWTNASIDRTATNPATNANYRPDAGLSWVRDENGNKALVYKYNMSNPTPFTSEDVLKLLTATPTDPTQRTLLGTEKEKMEARNGAGIDGYAIQNQAYTLNGNNIQLLDIVDTDHGWGKRNAEQTEVEDLADNVNTGNPGADNPVNAAKRRKRTKLTIPGSNGVGEVTILANGNENFLSYSKLMLVNTNMPVSNPALSGSYVNSRTQTNLYNVYLVGYKEVDIPIIGDLPNQVNGQYVIAKNNDANAKAYRIVPVFGNVTGTTETETGATNAAPVANFVEPSKTYRITLPEGEDFLIKYMSVNEISSYTMDEPNSIVYHPNNLPAVYNNIDARRNIGEITKADGKITGKFQWETGDPAGYRIVVKDAAGTTTLAHSNPVYFVPYTDRLKPNEPGLEAASATQLTKESIVSKLEATARIAERPHRYSNPDLIIDPSNYSRTIVGYREVTHTKTDQGVTKARGTTENLSDTTLNTLSAGKNYEIRVETTNVHGQKIYNWVPVNIYQLEAIADTEKRKFTDFDQPVHAIVELGSAGDVAAVKLKAALSSDFNLANFNISDTAVADLTKRNLEFVKATEVGADGTVGTIRTKGNGKVEYTGTGNIPYVFTYSYPDGPDADTNPESVDFTYTILYKDTQTPTVTPEAEYVRIVGEGYTISVPGTDNAYLQPGQLNGSLDIYSNNVRFGGSSVRTNLGVTSLSTELDVSGKDTSGGSDDQSGGSTKFKVKIEGTAPTTAGTGTYYLRVGDGNYPAGPEGAKAAENPGISEENVKVTPITITFVDRLKPIKPVPVTNQASLTPAEKAAVIQAVKDANPNNNKLQALPETAFTVNSDGSVSVNYGDNNVNGVTTSLSGATVPLTQVKEESKQAIEDEKTRQLNQIEADKQAEIAKIKANPDLNDAQKEAAENAINAAATTAAQEVTTAANTALSNIDNAADPAAAEKAKTDGLTAITSKGTAGKQSVDLEGAKATAKDDIDDALAKETAAIEAAKQADLTAIDNNPNLTPDQKNAAKQAVENAATAAVGALTDAANTAKANIDAADTPAKVSQAKKAGEDALDLEASKAAATNAINDAQVAKTADLEAKRKADLAAIEAADLTEAEETAAKEALNKTINDTIAAVNGAADTAKQGIATATSPADVATKQGEGLTAINTAATTTPQGAQPLDLLAAKVAATDAINDKLKADKAALETKRAEEIAVIDAANLTDAEKQAAKDALNATIDATIAAVERSAGDAKTAIDTATSPDDVATKQEEGLEAINTAATTTPQGAQPLDQLAAKVAATDAINDKFDAEKQAIEAKRDAEIAAITNNPDYTDDAAKQAAIDAIKQVAGDTLTALNNAATTAKKDIADQTTSDKIDSAKETGLDLLGDKEDEGEAAIDLIVAKTEATDAINDKLADEKAALETKRAAAIAAIEEANLTPEEEKAAKDALNDTIDAAIRDLEEKATDAKAKIAAADTPEAVTTAKTNGETALTEAAAAPTPTLDLLAAKVAATDAINDKLDAEKQAIEAKRDAEIAAITNNPDYTDDAAKQAAIDAIKQVAGDTLTALKDAAATAKQEIAAQTSPADVETKKSEGIDDLTGIEDEGEAAIDLIVAKTEATDAINDKLADEKAALETKRAAAIAAIEEANLTPAEEEAAKKALNDTIDAAIGDLETKATAAKAKIAAADTPEAVTTAKTNGETALTEAAAAPSPTLDLLAAKVAATDAINDKLDAEKQAIEAKRDAEIAAITNNPDYTDDAAKQAAIDAIKQVAGDTLTALKDAAATAKQEIAAQTSPADVETKKSEGIDDLTGIEDEGEAAIDLIVAKTEATDAIADKLADEVKELEAKQAEAEKAIDASTMTSEEKLAAKAELQKVVDAEKAKLAEEAKKATDAIGAADTPAKVADAKLEGVVALTEAGTKAEAAVELAKDKELAKEAIRTEAEEATKAAEKLAEDAIKAINDNPNLTDAEKQAEIDKVTDATAAALEAIADNADKATAAAEKAKVLADLEAAKKAQKDADKAAIDTATPLVEDAVLEAAKQDAVNKLEKDAAQAAKDIAANPNLTADQVKKALEDLAADLKAAKDDVASQTSPAAVQMAEDKGVAAIAEDVLEAAQLDALNKLAKDEKATIAAIESNPNLTPEEKAAARTKAEALADKAKSDILTAKTPAAVQTIEETADKALAKVEIKAAADDAKKAIAANPNLTGDEKAAAQAKVDAAVTAANTAIDGASSPAAIDAAVLTGEKAAAKEEVKAAADDAKKAIAANPNLTAAEKAAAQAKVDAAVTAANTAIDGASSPAAIDAAVLTGEKAAAKEEVKAAAQDAIKAIKENPNLTEAEKAVAVNGAEAIAKAAVDAIEDPATSSPAAVNAATLAGEKALAREEVRVAAEDAKKAIDANVNLSDAEKALAKSAVDSAVTTANAAIDGATNPATINTATLVGEKAIAKAEVVAAAEDAKKAIAANTNLTAAEKAAAQAKVDAAVTAANTAIDGATSPAAVNTATLAGEKAIAKEEVKVAAEDAKKAIAANTNLTAAEKAAAQAKVDAAVTTANTAIDGASSSAAVNTAILAGEKAIAKEEVKAAADDAKKAIDSNPNLTDAEKATAKAAVDSELNKATTAVDTSLTADAVDAATVLGEQEFAKDVLDAAKQDAKNKLAADAAAAKEAIATNPNLSDAEKATAKAAVDASVATANAAIDASTTPAQAQTAEDKGVAAITKDVLDAAKQDAKNKLAADAVAAKTAIDANPNLSDAEKQAAQAKVDASVTAATTAIAGSTTPAQAQTAEDKGVAAISENVLDAAKQDAKNKLAADAAAAKAAIDANPNLSDAEKAVAKDAVDVSVATATTAIDASTNPSETQAVEDKGVVAIAEDLLDAAKQGAKNKLMEEAEKAKAAIDANPNLTPEEKAAAKAEIDKAVEAAIIAINGAGALHGLGEIKLPLATLTVPVVEGIIAKVPGSLTEEENARIKALIEEKNAFPAGTEIIVAKDGSVTIKYPDATVDTVPSALTVLDVKHGLGTSHSLPAYDLKADDDQDAFTNEEELLAGTNPADATSTPEFETQHGTGATHSLPAYDLKADDDQDAFTNEEELLAGTNPADATSTPEFETQHGVGATHSLPAYDLKLDADKDGFTNGEELTAGTNPADATSKPATKSAKQLPNTGETATSATSLGLAVLGMGLALFATKRKKDEEEA
ncbi:TPA: DUF1542 domain-containing protein [Streptococcus suis]